MSFIELGDLGEVREKQLLKEGRYTLLVESAKTKRNEKSGKDGILVILSAEGQDNTANLLHNIALPHVDDESETKQFKMLMIKRFLVQFGIPFEDGVNTEAFSGSRGECNVTVDEYEGRQSNKLVLDPLPQS